MQTHKHKCGQFVFGEIKGYGCGHVWEHETTKNWFMKDHYCPNCGSGPFLLVYIEEANPCKMMK